MLQALLPIVDNFELAKSQLKLESEGEQKVDGAYQVHMQGVHGCCICIVTMFWNVLPSIQPSIQPYNQIYSQTYNQTYNQTNTPFPRTLLTNTGCLPTDGRHIQGLWP